jgi:hypothetical protein
MPGSVGPKGAQGRNGMPIFQINKVKFFQRTPEQDYGGAPVGREVLGAAKEL